MMPLPPPTRPRPRIPRIPGRAQPRTRPLSTTTLGIRKEDPKRIWERRAPLTPQAVHELVQTGANVQVESCARRCFGEDEYRHAGATIVPSLEAKVDLVLGIKEPPVERVLDLLQQEAGRRRRWMVFSHTHKGQSYNTPLLSSFLDPHKSQTLIDYELLTAPLGDKGELKRVAAFGWYAGAVGAGEALCMTGLALLRRGVASPLLRLPRPYTFPSLTEYKSALRRCGDSFKDVIMPEAAGGPVVIGITGRGNVSTGAKDMLDAMGVEWVSVEQLSSLEHGRIYACMVPPSSYLSSNGRYDRAAYYADPSTFTSSFSRTVAPYLTTLINGAGWQRGFPRTMTDADLDQLITDQGGMSRLVAVQDVACDLKGGLEFLTKHTTIDEPHWEGPGGILISSTDILPTELPVDASEHFSSKILPLVKHIASGASSGPLQETLDRGTIVRDGKIQERHAWLLPAVEALRTSEAAGCSQLSRGTASREAPRAIASTTDQDTPRSKQRVLLLGSGLVAGPAVEVFSARPDVSLVIGSNNLREATLLADRVSNAEAFALDVSDEDAVSAAVSRSDVVVSLLPAPMHVGVARQCIAHGKHLVTASYISPEMKALHTEAEHRNVLLLGECGLDPGIDSMAAMRILDRVKRTGKRVTSFISWCGGLPEPAASNVPFGYKFSWSPKAVLTAAGNDARFKLNGEIREVPGHKLLQEHFPDVRLWKGLNLEGVANRDAIPYADKYGLGEVAGLQNLFRGTLRYKGFSTLLDSFRQLGLLSTDQLGESVHSAPALLAGLLGGDGLRASADAERESIVKERLGDRSAETVEALKWLGIWPASNAADLPVHLRNSTPLDILAHVLSTRLAYAPHERDSCLLHHEFRIAPILPPGVSPTSAEHAGASLQEEVVTASLLHYGTPSASSMSITVGKTLAFAALRVLDGEVSARGVRGPYEREVWEGVLGRLEESGVRVEEKW